MQPQKFITAALAASLIIQITYGNGYRDRDGVRESGYGVPHPHFRCPIPTTAYGSQALALPSGTSSHSSSEEMRRATQNIDILAVQRLSSPAAWPTTLPADITMADIPAGDRSAVSALSDEVYEALDTIQTEIHKLPENSLIWEKAWEVYAAFEEIFYCLHDRHPRAIFVIRNKAGYLLAMRVLEEDLPYVTELELPNALGGYAVVRESYQGQGIGTRLAARALQWARDHDFDFYVANVRNENSRSMDHLRIAASFAGANVRENSRSESRSTFIVDLHHMSQKQEPRVPPAPQAPVAEHRLDDSLGRSS